MKILLKVKKLFRVTNITETKRLLLRNEICLSDCLMLTLLNNRTFTYSNSICELESDFTRGMRRNYQIPSNKYSLYQHDSGYNLEVTCGYGYKGRDCLHFKVDELDFVFSAEYENHDVFLRDLKLIQDVGVLQK